MKVFLNSNSSAPVFCRIIEATPDVEIDFNLLLRSMRLLFGSHCIVIFECNYA